MAKRKKTSVPQEETLEAEANTLDDSIEESVSEPLEEETTEAETFNDEESNVEEPVEEASENVEEEPEISEPESHTIELVYLGTSEKATVKGKVTGAKYTFSKDVYGMPQATTVDERDSSGILALEGKACCGKSPNKLFVTKQEWELEINKAKKFNR